MVFAIATLGFHAIGFGLMFSDGGFLGWTGGWLLSGADNSPAVGEQYRGIFGSLGWAGVPLMAKFFFQLVFCIGDPSSPSSSMPSLTSRKRRDAAPRWPSCNAA